MSRDKYHCPACGKLMKPTGHFSFEKGEKVNFDIQTSKGNKIRFRAATGTVVDISDSQVLIKYRGEILAAKRSQVTPADAPNSLTYAFSELCECPKESNEAPKSPVVYQWISWHQPGEDYRPLTFPPNPAILGWWCSGQTLTTAILCALVGAPDEPAAQAAVLKDWPEAEQWRFCEPRDNANLGDRFIPSGWMLERMPTNATESSM